MVPQPRIIVLTTAGSRYGLRLLNLLWRRQTPPDALVVRRDRITRKWRLLRSVARRIGWVDAGRAAAAEIIADAADPLNRPWRGAPLLRGYRDLAAQVHQVEDFGSPEVAGLLERLAPDLILLAQSGIVRDPVLAAARTGVLNAHPGRLPEYRGVDVPQWTLYEGRPDQLASTLHWVDAGIDTGAIVRVRAFLSPPELRFRQLQAAMYEDCLDLLAEAVSEVREGRILPRLPQPAGTGKQYFKMPAAARARARQHFERWQRTKGPGK